MTQRPGHPGFPPIIERPSFRLVILESPFQATNRALFRRNLTYSIKAMRDSIDRGEAPYLSHLLYPGALDDDIPTERHLGIALGYSWWPAADAICFYCDLGWSTGMVNARLRAQSLHKKIEERYIAANTNARPGHNQPFKE